MRLWIHTVVEYIQYSFGDWHWPARPGISRDDAEPDNIKTVVPKCSSESETR
jgi:hypothetical protein